MPNLRPGTWRRSRERSRGQSFVEFALVLPVLLLILLLAIDFGRVFLGWVNLQTMARTAAAYAAANPAASWSDPADPARIRYSDLVANDAKAINCDPTGGVGLPAEGDYVLGDLIHVSLSCEFSIVTPIISNILGGGVLLSASASYPVRIGFVPELPGGGGPSGDPPVADFVASPRSGYAPLTVTFTDASLGNPTNWAWSFSGATSWSSLLERDPTATWITPGCYSVTLTVTNAVSATADSYSLPDTVPDCIEVLDPPTAGPIPAFSASPRTGNDPLTVQFTDQSSGSPVTWQWDFDSDGTIDSDLQNPTHSYTVPGEYDVTLAVSDGTNTPNTLTVRSFILVDAIPCRVPNFFNEKKGDAQTLWNDAGFTTSVQFESGNGNYTIKTQSLAGTSIPPEGCAATITVGP